MARGNAKATPLDACTSITSLGNHISLRILEYLDITKSPLTGFNAVAVDFIEVSRSLFAARAGLALKSHPSPQLPEDVLNELLDRFQATRTAFLAWEQMVDKFLSNEKKKTFGKLGKGFRMMFAESDLEKMRITFDHCRASLSVSALIFTSKLGDYKVEAVGYTALAAVLHCADPTRPKPAAPSLSAKTQNTASSLPRSPPPLSPLPPIPSSDPFAKVASVSSRPWAPDHDLPESGTHRQRPLSEVSSLMTTSTAQLHGAGDQSSSDGLRDSGGDTFSFTTIGSTPFPKPPGAQISSSDGIGIRHAIRVKVDPSTLPRRLPSRASSHANGDSKMALVSAVQQKDHRVVEELLDWGVAPDSLADHSLLQEAVVNHDLETLRLLLVYGADVCAKDKHNSTPLYAATGHSFYEAAQLLVKYGASPNTPAGPYGENAFAISLTANKARFAQLFLQHGADTNLIMTNGDTPFTQAMNNYTPISLVEMMMVYDANPNQKNGRGETALFKAINAGRVDLVVHLLHHGADANMPGPKIVLWPAVHNPPMLEALLENGADLKRAPGVLELATSINSLSSVKILLKHGADPNAKKDGIYTPLCSAIRDDREDLFEILLRAGADPNLAALDYPVFKCITYHREHLLPRLLAAGADPNKPKGAIESAAAHDNRDALIYLLDKGVDVNARNPAGNTALTTAIRNENHEMIDLLLSHGADPAVRGHDWPISLAVKHPDILSKLLPHIPTRNILKGILEMAVVANELESVKLLLRKGVSIEEKNGGVFSPLTTSIRENRKDIFLHLLHDADPPADVNAPGEHLPIIKAIRRHREEDLSYIDALLDKGADVNLMYRGWNAVLQALDNGDLKILKLLARAKGGVDLDVQDESGRSVREILASRGMQEEEAILMSALKI